MKVKENGRFEKAKEQQEYQRLFEQNSQREIANELAYKKRFEDFDKNLVKKNQKYYDIVNDHDWRRDLDANKIAAPEKLSFADYYDQREKQKIQKSEELKQDSYQNMKQSIERNHRNIHEIGKKRREDAQKSVNELNQYYADEKQRKNNERVMQQQYRGILETQMKMKNQFDKFDANYATTVNSDLSGGKAGQGEMYMVPGINSVSPYLKKQRKGQVALGEHFMKMKQVIEKDKVRC